MCLHVHLRGPRVLELHRKEEGRHACINPDRGLHRHHKSEEIVSALCERRAVHSLLLISVWTSIFGIVSGQSGKEIGSVKLFV